MVIDEKACEGLADSILQRIKEDKRLVLYEQAPQPQGISRDELANYLVFSCAVESCIHQLFPASKTALRDAQRYLAWAAELPAQPYKPGVIIDQLAAGKAFYAFLRELADQDWPEGTEPETILPYDLLLDQTVQGVAEHLVHSFEGEGSRLAIDSSNLKGSHRVLLSSLERFEAFAGPKQEAYRRLYLKLAVRMNVWPEMAPPMTFLYPFNTGIAILFLNADCITVSASRKQIEIDSSFLELVADTEDQIVRLCYDRLSNATDEESVSFSRKVFFCDPSRVDAWALTDYIDLWLHGQTRQYCRRRGATNGDALGCLLLAEPNAPCFCDAARLPWRIAGDLLVRG